MANSLLHARRASHGPATPPSPRFPVVTAQLSPTKRVPRSNTASFGVFVVVAQLSVTSLVVRAPASLRLSLLCSSPLAVPRGWP